MTKDLSDGHYMLTFKNSFIKDSVIFPALDRKRSAPGYHTPYYYVPVLYNYLDPGYKSGFDNTIDPNKQLSTVCGTIDSKILYFTCNQFALFRSFHGGKSAGVRATLEYFFNNLEAPPAGIKGIIIDVRGNTGGDMADLDFLMGRFIDKPLQIGYSKYKNGNGRLDYTPWIEAFIHPQQKNKAVTIPLMVLADNFSASLAEAIVMSVSTLPNGIFIGETTWGATGPLIANEVYNSGEFSIPGFLSVQTSSAMFKSRDNKIYEGKGFPPDVPVSFNMSSLNAGHDPVLEKAISLIH
jgi:hypothetical protein